MKLERVLARGIGSWLQFEHACHRASVFSEKYLTVPIAQILNTKFGERVHSEVKHPVLGDLSPGRGRPPELDFVVYDQKQNIQIAIESKWIGPNVTKQTVEKIIWDLVRLAMIGNNDHVKCYFVLAGKKKYLTTLFDNKHFNGEKDKKGRNRPILKIRSNDYMDVRIDAPKEDRKKLLKPILKLCQDVELPMRLGTGRTQVYPNSAYNYEYQAYVWEIMPNRQKIVFKPKNHKHYKA
ncbi:hypothetical protein [Ekhidna sp.]|uniref:hypothetical protein n=1 Tax=Ekhidna sp. TaxID=2608089 RepID=UPI0035151284